MKFINVLIIGIILFVIVTALAKKKPTQKPVTERTVTDLNNEYLADAKAGYEKTFEVWLLDKYGVISENGTLKYVQK